MTLKWIRNGVLDLLFPPKCPFCRALLQRGKGELCPDCQRELPWLAGAEAEGRGEFFSLCVSPLRYQGVVREAFHRYKFGGAVSCAGAWGGLMAQCVGDHLAGRYDLITWVPLSRRRRRERGYDQTELLARAMAKALGEPLSPLLEKTRHTGAQSALSGAAERRANVLGAYRVASGAALAGKRVLLADDIATTGATLSECARILLEAGAAEVACVTFARAGERTGTVAAKK